MVDRKGDAWYIRQFKQLESYPAMLSVLVGIWLTVLQPAIAKEFATNEKHDKLSLRVDSIEDGYRRGDERIERKIDEIGTKIDDIYKILIKMR